MTIEKGTKAPGFTLYGSDKNKVSLADYAGKNTVLLVCTAELCSVRDNIASYNNSNAQVLGISVDSIFTLDKYKKEQNLNFPLLSDFNKTAAADYGVLYETFPAFEMQGVSKRAAFVIDKNGIIQYAEECPTPGDLPDFEAIQKTLEELS
jgi:glutaredoxin-dependent peroxiredoxin